MMNYLLSFLGMANKQSCKNGKAGNFVKFKWKISYPIQLFEVKKGFFSTSQPLNR